MEWLINLGYLGLFLAVFLAGTVIPISSDIMLLSVMALGSNPWLCLLVAITGNWLGLTTTYFMGWLGKWEWLERWFNVSREKLVEQKRVIDRYGLWIAVFTWIPLVGIVGLIALGFYRVKPKTTLLVLLIGCSIRFIFWVLLYVNYGQQLIDWVEQHVK